MCVDSGSCSELDAVPQGSVFSSAAQRLGARGCLRQGVPPESLSAHRENKQKVRPSAMPPSFSIDVWKTAKLPNVCLLWFMTQLNWNEGAKL